MNSRKKGAGLDTIKPHDKALEELLAIQYALGGRFDEKRPLADQVRDVVLLVGKLGEMQLREAGIREMLGRYGWDRPGMEPREIIRQLCDAHADLDKLRRKMRDDFAASALAGVIASPRAWKVDGERVSKGGAYAAIAYRIADAMMRARG